MERSAEERARFAKSVADKGKGKELMNKIKTTEINLEYEMRKQNPNIEYINNLKKEYAELIQAHNDIYSYEAKKPRF